MSNLDSSKWHLSDAAMVSNLLTPTNGGELNKARAGEGRGKVGLQIRWKTLNYRASELPSAENSAMAPRR